MAGIKDIAKAAGVSVSTVSNALNNRKNVSEETRLRVLEVCRAMNYSPNLMAKNLKSGKTNIISFNFSDFERVFHLQIIKGINDCLIEYQKSLIICPYNSATNFLNNKFVDGAIILDKNLKDQFLMSAADENMRMVVMDRVLNHPFIDSIVVDNYPSMCGLVQELVDKGYKNFSFVGGIEKTLDHIERFQAFRDILENNQLLFSSKQYYKGDYTIESGYKAGSLMAVVGNVGDVVVCANDNMAIGVMNALQANGYSIPGNIAVTGFDDEDIAKSIRPSLTTLAIPRYEMGYLAAQTLIEAMNGGNSMVLQKIKASIQWRESTL